MSYIGIDLAARPTRVTGLASISGGLAETASTLDDEHLLAWVLSRSPVLVAVDSPLSMPRSGPFRDVDRALISMGYRVLPVTWKHMRDLTLRAMALSSELARMGSRVIETHPTSALRSSNCKSAEELVERLNLKLLNAPSNRHEEDALVAAVVAYAVREGLAVEVRGSEGLIYLLRRLCS